MRFGLVLGAGGLVGIAYHAGVLAALEEVAGIVPHEADLIVGTSAGSVVGAHIRMGRTTAELYELARAHPDVQAAERGDDMFQRAWRTPVGLVRRGIGSAFVIGRSLVRFPMPRIPSELRSMFPGGFYAVDGDDPMLAERLPEEWPQKALWLNAVDIRTGRRVVMGRSGHPHETLQQAVLASCAIPGWYQPVRIGGRTLVDGGVHSTTNLDLAAKAGCRFIVGSVPMGFDPAERHRPARLIGRSFPNRSVEAEIVAARGQGAQVLLFRPTAAELPIHGPNGMRSSGLDLVAEAAYEAATERLSKDRSKQFVDQLERALAAA
ncbi:MAG: patatin-like phospholipase family protein [Actinomycetia bacterium]|nr:patatin-like phospholipase family protein [Actinomycetes bacterium]